MINVFDKSLINVLRCKAFSYIKNKNIKNANYSSDYLVLKRASKFIANQHKISKDRNYIVIDGKIVINNSVLVLQSTSGKKYFHEVYIYNLSNRKCAKKICFWCYITENQESISIKTEDNIYKYKEHFQLFIEYIFSKYPKIQTIEIKKCDLCNNNKFNEDCIKFFQTISFIKIDPENLDAFKNAFTKKIQIIGVNSVLDKQEHSDYENNSDQECDLNIRTKAEVGTSKSPSSSTSIETFPVYKTNAIE